MAVELPPPRAVVLCRPDHFDVVDAENPHMVHEGQLQRVDADAARKQWNSLVDAYRSIGVTVDIMDAADGLPDQVFTANPVFAYPRRDGSAAFIPARMRYPSRQPEVDLLDTFLQQHGATATEAPGNGRLEGGGDLLWKGTARILLGGHGFRSDLEDLRAAASVVDAPLIPLRLVDERFYHLDTCLCVLDDETAMWFPDAFDDASWWRLQDAFETLLEVPEAEALTFACNAHCPDGHHVVMDRANQGTAGILADAGFEPVLVDTSEFRKSGGSVYCMKQVVW